ncbi:glycoside hydrolase family 27 protein [Xylariaceae sp. FL0255]|nr:glycoside hydrolase family 27 protein [Xylariaceae sp. FL0255]
MSRSAVFVALFSAVSALVWPDGTARVPALGWNSWNAYGCDVNETKVLDAAQALIDLGLKDLGYEYVNIDDCWSEKTGRDPTTNQLLPNTTLFPDGISGLADKIHDMGLRIGIYSSAGTETCAGYPASIGYETLDAETWAAWGIDYLKYDNCNIPSNWTDACTACLFELSDTSEYTSNGTCVDPQNYCPDGYNYTTSNSAKRYAIMRDALLAQNRTILYSLCEWGTAGVEEWGNVTGNSWRMSDDVQDNFASVLSILNQNTFNGNYADFWGHPDADMLELGNGGLNQQEERTMFAFWAAMKSPLLIGTNLDTASNNSIATLSNKYLIDFNQDAVYGKPAIPYKWGTNPDWTFNYTFPAQYWSGESQQGTLVLLLNPTNDTANMTVDFSEVPSLTSGGSYDIVDVWTGDDQGTVSSTYTVSVDAHDTAALLLS